MGGLEIVKDHAKIKNIRKRQGIADSNESVKNYAENYERIWGKKEELINPTVEHFESQVGRYSGNSHNRELKRVSKRIPSGKLVTL